MSDILDQVVAEAGAGIGSSLTVGPDCREEKRAPTKPIEATLTNRHIISNFRENRHERSHYD